MIVYKVNYFFTFQEITEEGSPTLSHHACVVVQHRYLVIIGGWDGKARVSDVHVFDTESRRWMHPQTSGFPTGAGLSSHTATLLDNGDILIIGREGSLRMQRRSGNAFLLTGDITSRHMKYTEHVIGVSSRSGHTVHVSHSTMYTIGGRSDQLIELHSGSKVTNICPTPLTKLVESVSKISPMKKPPGGRKHHISVAGKGCIFIHGGETFDGRSREPVSDIILMTLKPYVQYYKIEASPVGRAGHVCGVSHDKIIIHGGIGEKNVVTSDTFQLVV